MLPPTTIATQTMSRERSAIHRAPGDYLDVPASDASVLRANGWTEIAMSGATTARPVPASRSQHCLRPHISGVTITYDGSKWRDPGPATPSNPPTTKTRPAHPAAAENAPSDGATRELNPMPKFQSKATSAARSTLARNIDARAEVDSKLAELRRRVAKLNSASRRSCARRSALAGAEYEAEDYAALHGPLRGDSEFDRTPDLEARDRLARELAAARDRQSRQPRHERSRQSAAQMTPEVIKANDIQIRRRGCG